MVRKYQIKEVTQDWLSKPGTIIYVEKEYDELVNDYLEKHLTHLQELCQQQGLVFLYIPRFYSSLPKSMLKYFTGKEVSYSTKIHTYDILNSILSQIELSQIEEPSFIFTGTSQHECTAFSIGHDTSILGKVFTSRKEKHIETSIHQILTDARSVYGELLPEMPKVLNSYADESEREYFRGPDTGTRFRISDYFNKILDEDLTNEEVDQEDEDFNSDACQQAQKLVARLLDKGYSKETIWALLSPMKELSPIKITRDLRITLPAYQMEIELPPVQKAVYLLFLKHPEGIHFKDMPDYQEELYLIYRKVAVRGEKQKHLATIADLSNPLSNSMNEKCSIIKRRVLALLDDELAQHYYISGEKGEIKQINIRPNMIVWE